MIKDLEVTIPEFIYDIWEFTFDGDDLLVVED